MSKKTVILSCTFLLVSAELHAQTQTSGEVGVGVSSQGSAGGFDAYNQRYKPQANTWELGLFAGLLFPSSEHNIFAAREDIAQEPYADTAFEIGTRLGYFFLPYLGVEASAFAAPSEVESGRSAMLYGASGVVVGQLPTMSLTPFVLVGGGMLGGVSEPMGNDMDPAVVFGAGLKAPLSEHVALRLDVRDTMTQKFDAENGDQTHHPEILLGVTFFAGRSSAAEVPLAPPDSDRDGLSDAEDKCPRVAALTPDGCPEDSDGDGVLDPDDHCPREAGQEPDGCPDLDEDGDGVPLPCDKCPEEKGVAPDGCPIRDTDGDGFMDDVDKCPDQPETKNGYQAD